MGWISILTLGVGLVFLIRSVISSATCVEKFLDGETADTKHEVTVGERVTLRCDVSARDPAKDMVYWKFDDEVMSQDALIIDKYRSKFNVTLDIMLEPKNETLSGKDIYTLSWIAELDDAGKYNCTCTTGGIQYPVWIKRPCNRRKHVRLTTNTSDEVIKYLRTNTSYQLQEDKTLDFKVGLDCNCTWPEVNRTFTGKWYRDCTDEQCPNCANDTWPTQLGIQDSSITPIGCYTGKGAVTYRYRNVFGSFATVVFNCTEERIGNTYNFCIDEGENKRPDEHDTIMSIYCNGTCDRCPCNRTYNGKPCTESRDKFEMEYNANMQMMNIKPDVCNTMTVLFNDMLLNSTFRVNGILVMSQFDKKCTSPSCLWEFKCQIPGIYKLNHGKDTRFEIHCAEGLCERCPSNGIYNGEPCTESKDKITIKYNDSIKVMNIIPDACSATTVLFNDNLLDSVMSQFDKKCNSPSCLWEFKCQIPGIYKLNHGKDTQFEIHCESDADCAVAIRSLKIILMVTGLGVFICIVVAIVNYCYWRRQTQEDAKKPKNTKGVFIAVIIVVIIVLLSGAVASAVLITQRCSHIDQLLPVGVIIGIAIVLIFAVLIIVVSSVCLHRFNKMGKPDGKYLAKNPRLSTVSQISNSSRLPLEQGQIIPSITPYPGNPNLANGGINGIFNPAYVNNRSAYKEVSPSQTQPKEKDIANENIPLSVKEPKVKYCMKCLKSPVQVYFKPCRHAACTSCAKSIFDKSSQPSWPALCPECKESVSDYQNICKVCSESPVIGYLTPCNHEGVCKICAMEMMKKPVAYCPDCGIEVDHYRL